uniref:NADH-ubiquinone oxidoreductase chain 1 n=1 Tax=Toxarium undulatum TaxID=210620 RepID=A0A2U9GIZ3_9STRA|nr:NADH dehydrogenase subunit 1 [Toxarium undulatum]AWQ64145.1 NADH dehydrogenase subunit 1 [Toxarium undulatum]
MLFNVIITILEILCIVIPLLISVAYFTIAERKLMGVIQRRRGPNVVGFVGLLQPLADGLKLFAKETIFPSNSDGYLFILAPILTFVLSLLGWAVIPFAEDIVLVNLNVGVLYLFAISSLSVYGIIIAGWSSNSKYPFLGALRSAAQMISYEVSIGIIISTVALCSGSLNLSLIVFAQNKIWFIVPLFPLFVMFCISMLAETNRHPFDLPEAEAELVSGYNVEYSSMTFALFFLGEYANMLLMSAFLAILFLGGWLPLINVFPFNFLPGSFWFSLKIIFGVIFFIVTRAALPRYRYDQLMDIGWKCFLPFSIGYFVFTAGILISFDWLPTNLQAGLPPANTRFTDLYKY